MKKIILLTALFSGVLVSHAQKTQLPANKTLVTKQNVSLNVTHRPTHLFRRDPLE